MVLFQTVLELVIWENLQSVSLMIASKRASMASLLSAYSGFQCFCLCFHVQIKIQLQFEELPKLQIGSPVHSLNVTVFKLVGICTSRRLVFLEWKITKIVSGYAISGRVLLQNLAQSCSFALVT